MALYNPPSGNTGSISAGTTRGTLGEVVLSNSNGLTFGMNGQTITGSYTVPSTAGLLSNVRVSAGTTSNLLSALTFDNSNGLTFGLNASTITASHNGLTSQSNQAVSAANGSYAFQTLSFSNANGLSFGTSAGSAVTGSYTVPTVTNSSMSVSDAATSGTLARIAFTNLNGVTLSLSTGAGGSHTIVGSHNALTSQSNQNVTAGNGGFAFQTLSFSNVNGISFGTSAGSAITASHNALTTARASNDAIGLNTAQTNVTWTVNSSGLSLNAGGYAGTVTAATNATLTLNSAGLSISVGAGGGGDTRMTAYATGNTTQSSTGTIPFSSYIFRGSGAASVGVSNGSIVVDVAAGAAAITQSIGMSTQTAGGATAGTTGYATGDDVLYHFAPGSNITMSQSVNGASATLSIYGPSVPAVSSYFNGYEGLTLLHAGANANVSLQRLQVNETITATMFGFPVYQSISSSAVGNTYGQQWTVNVMILTNDTANNRLMSLSSGSTQTTYTLASNTAGATQIIGSGVRPITCPINVNMTPGVYFAAVHWSTNTFSSGTATTALNRTASFLGRAQIMSASFAMVSAYDQATGNTVDRIFPQGVLSNGATAAIPLTISHSQITMTGLSHSQANLAFFLRA